MFGFSTKRYDAQTGLSYYGYRFYSPEMGRWTTRDPLGEAGGINLYAFVGNNPINWVDPWGLSYDEAVERPCGFEFCGGGSGARDLVGGAAGLGLVGLLDAILSKASTGKNDKHANQKKKEAAKKEYENVKKEYDELSKTPNKTPELKKQLKKLEKQLKHQKDKIDWGGETHHRCN